MNSSESFMFNKLFEHLSNISLNNYDDIAKVIVENISYPIVYSNYHNRDIWRFNIQSRLWEFIHWKTFKDDIKQSLITEINFRIESSQIKNSQIESSQLDFLINLRDKILNCLHWKFVCNSIILYIEYNSSFESTLDIQKNLLPIKDGKVLDLIKGNIRQRTQEDYFTYEIPYDYDPNCDSPIIEAFLNNICFNDEDLKNYFQYVFGSCLTGNPPNKEFYIIYTNKTNGEFIFMDLLKKILNNQYQYQNKVSYTARGFQKKLLDFDINCITKKGNFNGGMIKSLACDEIRTDITRRGRTPITYTPQYKSFLITTHIPGCNRDRALLYRLKFLPLNDLFTEITINNETINISDIDKIISQNDMNYLFSWLILGAIRSNREKPIIPKRSKRIEVKYMLDSGFEIPDDV